MKKIISHMHVSLDGFAAGPNGEMDWIKADEEMFNFGKAFTDNSDTALYGRVTWEMMDNYWPTAGVNPNATKHDIDHSEWYNKVEKIVISNTKKGQHTKLTTFIGEDIEQKIKALKQKDGKNIQIFGSPSVVRFLMKYNLIDEYWLFLNPVILGRGISMFTGLEDRIELKYKEKKEFSCGVIALNCSND